MLVDDTELKERVARAIQEEREIYAALQASREIGFERYFQRYAPTLFRSVRRLRPDLPPEDVEEIVDDVLLEAEKTYDPSKGRLSTWLVRILKFRTSDRFEKVSSTWERQTSDAALEWRAAPDNPEQEVISREPLEGWDMLTRHQKDVIGLQYYYGYSQPEIGRLMGIEPSSVKTVAQQAREKLRKMQPRQSPSADTGGE